MRGIAPRACLVILIPTPPKLPRHPHKKQPWLSPHDVTKDSGQEASRYRGRGWGLKCLHSFALNALWPWNLVSFQKTIGCTKGVSSPFPRGDAGSPTGPWSQERRRPRQRKKVDPLSLSASDMLLYMACYPGRSHSSHRASVSPRSDPGSEWSPQPTPHTQ